MHASHSSTARSLLMSLGPGAGEEEEEERWMRSPTAHSNSRFRTCMIAHTC